MTDTNTFDTNPDRSEKSTSSDGPSAPYGRNLDGTLLDKDGQPAPLGLRQDGKAKRKPGPSKGTGPSSAKAVKKGASDYRPGILGVAQVPVAFLAGLGAASGNDMFLADAQIIGMAAPGIAEALNDLAQENRQIAGALDRLMKVGPYSALSLAVLPMAVQIGVNHGIVPPGIGSKMGAAYTPEDLADAAKSDLSRMTEAQADGRG